MAIVLKVFVTVNLDLKGKIVRRNLVQINAQNMAIATRIVNASVNQVMKVLIVVPHHAQINVMAGVYVIDQVCFPNASVLPVILGMIAHS
jgi:hypothetical protein